MEGKFFLGKTELFTKEQAESLSVDIAFEKAPYIVHQKLCAELTEILSKVENQKKVVKDIPDAMEIIMVIRILKRIYPQLEEIK